MHSRMHSRTHSRRTHHAKCIRVRARRWRAAAFKLRSDSGSTQRARRRVWPNRETAARCSGPGPGLHPEGSPSARLPCRPRAFQAAFPEQLGVSPIDTSSPAAARPARPRLSPHPHIHARRMPLPFINHTIRRLRNSPPTFSHWQAHSTIADEGKRSQVEWSDCR